jgi:DNA-binding response OmpR family regulator
MERPPRILIIDDDEDLIRLLAMVLKKINADSVGANDGTKGLQVAEEDNRPDLIILDLMLPDMDGLEVLQRLRSKPEIGNIPVLILSARTDPLVIRRVLDQGADAYITKPYNSKLLLERVQALIAARRAHQPPAD